LYYYYIKSVKLFMVHKRI